MSDSKVRLFLFNNIWRRGVRQVVCTINLIWHSLAHGVLLLIDCRVLVLLILCLGLLLKLLLLIRLLLHLHGLHLRLLLMLLFISFSVKFSVAPVLSVLILDLLCIVIEDADEEELDKDVKDQVDAHEQPEEVIKDIIAIFPVNPGVSNQVAGSVYDIVHCIIKDDHIEDVD